MADPTIDNILDRRAAFGANFLGTTNLAQRRRYQEDIESAKAAEEEAAQAQFGRANRSAELADPLKARAIRLDERRFERAGKEFSIQEQRLQRSLEVAQRAEELRERKQLWDEEQKLIEIDDANKILDHSMGLRKEEAKLRQMGIKPKTKEYADAVADWVERYDHADPKLLDGVLKNGMIGDSMESIISKKAELRKQGIEARMRLTEGPNGSSFTLTEQVPVAENPRKLKRDLLRDIKLAQERFTYGDESKKPFWANQIKEMEDEYIKLGQPVKGAANQKSTSSNPEQELSENIKWQRENAGKVSMPEWNAAQAKERELRDRISAAPAPVVPPERAAKLKSLFGMQ